MQRSPLIPLSTGGRPFPLRHSEHILTPSQARRDSNAARRGEHGGSTWGPYRTGRRWVCPSTVCRRSTGPREACERLRRTDAAMKSGQELRWRVSGSFGRSRRGSADAKPSGSARPDRSKSRPVRRPALGWRRHHQGTDLTGRRWEKSRRRLSLGTVRPHGASCQARPVAAGRNHPAPASRQAR